MRPRHILICGEVGAGKSTLIARLTALRPWPVYGFVTKRMAANEEGFHPIYIHPAGAKERREEQKNCVGSCDSKTTRINAGVFDSLGADYLEAAPGGVIVMDELGFMESREEGFVRAVFAALNGDVPVLAAVKARYDVEFLNRVRAHPKCELFIITPQNREELFEALAPRILEM